jgi:uncharacterized protein YeeX (DUF496 family)
MQHTQQEVVRMMDDKPKSKKDHSKKKKYVKPESTRIPLDDEERLLEYCRSRPYSVQELKEAIKEMLRPHEEK